jgi:tricorn protease
MYLLRLPLIVFVVVMSSGQGLASSPAGYYRQPTIHKDTLVFVSEGDLWTVSAQGGVAMRLTAHPGLEGAPAISPDGQTLAFTAQYEGPAEIYTMTLAGGQPVRRTYGVGRASFVGWTPEGKLLIATDRHATLPAQQFVILDLSQTPATPTRIPLAQGADGCFADDGQTLFFTRLPFQGSHTRRYQGGTAQNLWKFTPGAEAVPLTADYAGTSKNPLWWHDRVYFASDRDGTMNLWSMKADGSDRKQHTHHAGWDVASPALSEGRLVYQLGADLHVYDIAADTDRLVPIALVSDLDQRRERWIKKPLDYLTSAHLAPDGSRVALTARGRVFVAPHRQGRLVEATHKTGVRYRDARFLPDGKSLLALSDESGEVELARLPANGAGPSELLTHDGEVLRWEAVPSPDGKRIAHHDKNQQLFLFDLAAKKNRRIDTSDMDQFTGLSWSPDSQWLAYVARAGNQLRQIKLYDVASGQITAVTTDRYDSYSPAWSPDGHWLYFLSDRHFKSVVPSPWGTYQPEPFFDKKTKIYHLSLTEDQRSPWDAANELVSEPKESPAKPKTGETDRDKKPPKPPSHVKIDRAGLEKRLIEVPVPPGNYSTLTVTSKALFWLSTPAGETKAQLRAAAITRHDVEVKTVTGDVRAYELSLDGNKLLVRKEEHLYILDVEPTAAKLDKKEVKLEGWMLALEPREEWRQMFAEAWRLERDYFYDRGMHGLDWPAVRRKYEPLVERVNSRDELADLLAQMVAELSALHIFVRPGDVRHGPDDVMPAHLGGEFVRDAAAGGYRVSHIYQSDPDEPEKTSPLTRPGVGVKEGDVIETIDGLPTLAAGEIGALLRHKAGRQVLLHVKPAGRGAGRDVIVTPISAQAAADLRYREWEYTRRLAVEQQGKGDLGYVHLRAMASADISEWARSFYPIFTRKGLIIDVRNNGGGNIDSWVLGRLLRKAWFHWNARVGRGLGWNMQYAFRGHIAVLCNEFTGSDGEAFTEGVRRLGIGKVIGTRTWGGEIWLSSDNFLVDKGIATAAEYGVYGPEGTWLIEGHGVDPDFVVDNPPHATFLGEDAQLQAAIAYLQRQIREKPVVGPSVPKFPNKAAGQKD